MQRLTGERRALKAAILIGGASRRMGRPKALLRVRGVRLIDRLVELCRPHVAAVALVGGDRELRDAIGVEALGCIALDDAPVARGPLAGIIAALESDAQADWLVLGCDMPAVTPRAIEWLLTQGLGECDATMAVLPDAVAPEPLLALYSPRGLERLREAAGRGNFALHAATAGLRVRAVPAPAELRAAWTNANTPAEWARSEFPEPQH